ncbi:hypothetical protein [Desulfonatronum parangueonense]
MDKNMAEWSLSSIAIFSREASQGTPIAEQDSPRHSIPIALHLEEKITTQLHPNHQN